MSVTRRKFIRVISYLVAVCVIFAATGLFSQRAKAGYEETLGKVRMTNLGSLCEYFRDISAGLRLLAVSEGESVNDSISYVTARIMGARGCLNGFDSKKIKNTDKFINTVASFTDSFSGSSEQRKIAIYLSEYAQEVYYHLNDVSSAIMNGAYSLTEYGSIYENEGLPYFEEYVDYSNGNEKELFGAAAPASASENGSIISGKEEITEETAKNIASSVTGINSALWRENKIKNAAYSFCHGDVAVEISKSGHVCRLINPKPCKTAELSVDEAEEKAAEYLEKLGYADAVAVKREISEFTASFLFYPEVNGVLLMTSPIEIQLCRASGDTVFLDALGYMKKYRDDIFPPEELPDIRTFLPKNLTLKQSFYCFTKFDGKEKICVLSLCESEGCYYRVYTDLESLKIIKIEFA